MASLRSAATSKARPVPVVVAGSLQSLGSRVTIARKLRGWTQAELAHLADVSLSTIRSIEDGAEGIGVANLLKVMDAFGLLSQVDALLDPRHDPETLAFAERQLGSA